MNQRQEETFRRFREARAFLGVLEPRTLRIAGLERELIAIIDAIKSLGARRSALLGGRTAGQTTARDIARRALRRGLMLPLSRYARRQLRHQPGMAAAVAVPHATASDAELVAAARRMAKWLTQFLRVLRRDYGYNPLTRLRAAAADLKRIGDRVPRHRKEASRMTGELRRLFTRGSEIRAEIEGLVAAAAVKSPGMWEQWVRSSRKPKKPGPKPGSKRRPAPGP